MSEENFKVYAAACRILEGTFKELGELFSDAETRQQANGTRHKDKAAEKDAQRVDDALGTAASPDKKGEVGKEEKKGKPKKATPKDANGNDLKRPLSAYMLYNNHRRPVLRSEHPELSLPDLSKLIGDEWKKLSDNQKATWKDKAREHRLEFEIKTFNAKRAGDEGAEGSPAKPETNTDGQMQIKTDGPVNPAAQANAAPKTGDNDDISDFTEENADKPAENGASAAAPATTSAAQGSPAKADAAAN